MNKDFISTYLDYNVGNECPKPFHVWSALVTLAATIHKQVWLDHSYSYIYPNIYVGLIGKQGDRKSSAKNIARTLFTRTFPDYHIGASVQSMQDIIINMSKEDTAIFFRPSENETAIEVRPLFLFINELKNFLSINPTAMIDFLTDIYDETNFRSSTVKRGLEDIPNPCINILACETPEWIIGKLKMNIISGGFARRMIYVYETDPVKLIAFPHCPENHRYLYDSLQSHLLKLSTIKGQFTWTDECKKVYEDWYLGLTFPTDSILLGYYRSKHIQALKLTMLLALAEPEPKLVIRSELFLRAVAFLDAIEVNLPKLSVASGRNDLAIPIQTILEILERCNGAVPTTQLKRRLDHDMTPMEQSMVLKHLHDTEQIFGGEFTDQKTGVRRHLTMLRSKYDELQKRKADAAAAASNSKPE